MPELPDITIYVERLRDLVVGHALARVRLVSPFLLRSVEPALSAFAGLPVRDVSRLGKRIVLGFDHERFLVLHLMVAGRLQWRPTSSARIVGKIGVCAFDFDHGTLLLTEAGKKKRASLYAVEGRDRLEEHDPGGVEVLDCTLADFARALTAERHTLKRALTDPRTFSGIGNAYSDEILHRARLSPLALTTGLDDESQRRLFHATRAVLVEWTERLRREAADQPLPTKVTAFRDGMAVHGRAGQPCPVCGSPVQKIAYADRETNYCATCQTGGKLLADRAMSRLMKQDWPRTLDELEALKRAHAAVTALRR